MTAPRIRFWKVEEPAAPWHEVTDSAAALAEARGQGAMYVTTCSYDRRPLRAPEERADLLKLAVHRRGNLLFDLDAKDPEDARRDALRLVARVATLGVPPEVLRLFFSGSKGFHVLAQSRLLGPEAADGDRLLPMIHAAMAERLAGDLPTFDRSIYSMGLGRMFRLPNIKRSNGRHKIPLTLGELDSLPLAKIIRLSGEPRTLPAEPVTCHAEALRELFLACRAGVYAQVQAKPERKPLSEAEQKALQDKVPACIKHVLAMQDYDGTDLNFNKIVYSVLIPYFRQAGFTADEALNVSFDWLVDFTGSASYSMPEVRIEHFKESWSSASAYAWNCGITKASLRFDGCAGCAVASVQAVEVFADVIQEAEDQTAPAEGQDEKSRPCLMSFGDLAALEFRDEAPIDGLVDKDESIIILGANGVGKSLLTADLALALASPPADGMLWGRFRIVKPLRTLLIQSEVTAKGLHKRILRMAPPGSVEALAAASMIRVASLGQSGRVTGTVTDRRFQGQLLAWIEEFGPDVVLIDPLSSFHSEDENSSGDMRRALDALTATCDRAGGVVHGLVHHLGENSGNKQVFKGRGASGVGDWAANIVMIERVAGGLLKLSHLKGRNFATGQPIFLERGENLRVAHCAAPSGKDDAQVAQVVAALTALGGSADSQDHLASALVTSSGKSESTCKRWVKAAADAGALRFEKQAGRKATVHIKGSMEVSGW